MLTLGEDSKALFWNGQNLVDSFELQDDDIKAKLGTENLILVPKAYAYMDGVLVVGYS